MTQIIKVNTTYRIIRCGKPVGDHFLDSELDDTLSRNTGDFIVNLRTKDIIYRFNWKDWQWELQLSPNEKWYGPNG